MQMKKGISLIVLVITIIVMIILAASVVISLSNNGIIGRANEAVFKQNVKGYITELSMYMSDLIIENPRLEVSSINSDATTIGEMIKSIKEEDKSKFAVIGGSLVYNGTNSEEEIWCNQVNVRSILTYSEADKVNVPKLADGMIPVKYDESKSSWVKADKNNINHDWYKYDEETRQWANVVTVTEDARETYEQATVGTPIDMEDITTMFVWIPRYAYSINEGYYKTSDTLAEDAEASNEKVDISFLVGTTNTSKDAANTYTSYEEDYDASLLTAGDATPKIVHPAFTFGETKLTGIWVAKFEASGHIPGVTITSDLSTYAGNMPADATTLKPITEDTYVTVLPNVPSWRSITMGESQTQSMKMKNNTDAYGFVSSNIDTHLMKNSEWGAVAYLSASPYGKVPMINEKVTYASSPSHYYDILTGYQGNANAYDTAQGMKASTTHNIYGIYDLNGGSWERVAAYLDNGNSNLSSFAGTYFENNVLKTEYTKYWDKYNVSEEEKTNKIKVVDLGDGITEVTQGGLWTLSKTINDSVVYTNAWNEARYRITKATYDLMAANKGDAMYETMGSNSYYGLWYNTSTSSWTWNWLKEAASTNVEYGIAWNYDYTLLGHAAVPFVYRGGHYGSGVGAGLFGTLVNNGYADINYGFRPVCVAL